MDKLDSVSDTKDNNIGQQREDLKVDIQPKDTLLCQNTIDISSQPQKANQNITKSSKKANPSKQESINEPVSLSSSEVLDNSNNTISLLKPDEPFKASAIVVRIIWQGRFFISITLIFDREKCLRKNIKRF